jgi:hypothetical protein
LTREYGVLREVRADYYKRAQSRELKEYRGVKWSTREHNGVVEFSSVGSENSSSGVSSP